MVSSSRAVFACGSRLEGGETPAFPLRAGSVVYNASMKKQRLDTLLVERGYCADADAALRAVLAREVKVGDAYAASAAMRVPVDAEIAVKGRKRFVSRGGWKQQGALEAFGQEVRGARCLTSARHRRLHRLPLAGGRGACGLRWT